MNNFNKESFSEIKNISNFQKWLEQFQLSEKTIKLYCIVIGKYYKTNNRISQFRLNKFIKDNPHWYTRSAIKYWLEFKYGHKKASEFNLIRIKPLPKRLKDNPPIEKLMKIFDKVERSSKNRELKLLYRFLLMTGARIHEVLGLRLKNFDFKNQRVIFKTKGGYIRDVKLTKDFMEKLRIWIVEKRGLLANDIVFFSNSKTRESAYRLLRYHLKKLKLSEEEIGLFERTHNFRRAIINHILDLTNDDIFKAYAFIGHKKIDTTMKYVSERKIKRAKEETYKILGVD